MDPASRMAVVDLISLLIARDYEAIEQATNGVHLTAKELEAAVDEYGKTLVLPAGDDLQLDEVEVAGRIRPTWSVRHDLWTKEDGRSDLSLELTVVRNAAGPVIEVDGLHVLWRLGASSAPCSRSRRKSWFLTWTQSMPSKTELSGSSSSRSRTASARASNQRRMSCRSVHTKMRTAVGITDAAPRERRARAPASRCRSRCERGRYARSAVPDLGGALPPESPAWDLNYAYSGGSRVVKSATDRLGVERHTLEIFATLRLDRDQFLTATGDYERHRGHTHAYLGGGVGHVFYDGGTLIRRQSFAILSTSGLRVGIERIS